MDRRPLRFWQPFNDWWRKELEKLGRRPNAQEIVHWYNHNAAQLWGDEAPSIQETRVHAKCLRSLPLVRDYFRTYRAKKKGGGPASSGSLPNGDDDDTDATDTAQGHDHTAPGSYSFPEQARTYDEQQQAQGGPTQQHAPAMRDRRVRKPKRRMSDQEGSWDLQGEEDLPAPGAGPQGQPFVDQGPVMMPDPHLCHPVGFLGPPGYGLPPATTFTLAPPTFQPSVSPIEQQQELVKRYLAMQAQQSAVYQQQLAMQALSHQLAAHRAARQQQQQVQGQQPHGLLLQDQGHQADTLQPSLHDAYSTHQDPAQLMAMGGPPQPPPLCGLTLRWSGDCSKQLGDAGRTQTGSNTAPYLHQEDQQQQQQAGVAASGSVGMQASGRSSLGGASVHQAGRSSGWGSAAAAMPLSEGGMAHHHHGHWGTSSASVGPAHGAAAGRSSGGGTSGVAPAHHALVLGAPMPGYTQQQQQHAGTGSSGGNEPEFAGLQDFLQRNPHVIPSMQSSALQQQAPGVSGLEDPRQGLEGLSRGQLVDLVLALQKSTTQIQAALAVQGTPTLSQAAGSAATAPVQQQTSLAECQQESSGLQAQQQRQLHTTAQGAGFNWALQPPAHSPAPVGLPHAMMETRTLQLCPPSKHGHYMSQH